MSDIRVCKEEGCETLLTRRQKSFCSKKCCNTFNSRVWIQQHKENYPDRWRVCDVCGKSKNLNKYSLLDKTRYITSERKTTCKKCSKSISQKKKRDRDWKYESKKIMYRNMRNRCKRSGMEFSITEEDILIPELCPVLGIPLKRESRDSWYSSPSIDRIDNTKGYIPGNIIVVSRRVNILKKDGTIEEIVKIGEFYRKYL